MPARLMVRTALCARRPQRWRSPASRWLRAGAAALAIAALAEPPDIATATSAGRGNEPAGARASDDTTWTLARCEQAASIASPRLAAVRARVAGAEAQREEAAARLYPELGLHASYRHVTEVMALTLPSLDTTPGRRIEFGDGSTSDLFLGVRAPLLSGGSLRNNVRAQTRLWEAQRHELAADSLALRTAVRGAYFAALGAAASAEAAQQAESRLRRHLADVEANLAIGSASVEMRLQALSRLLRAERTTLRAQNEAALRRLALGELVGRAGDPVWPAGELDRTLLDSDQPEVPIDERPEMTALASRAEAARHTADAIRGGLFPTLDLEGGWHYGRPGIDQVSNDWMDYGTIALSANWKLWDHHGRARRIQTARAENHALVAARRAAVDAAARQTASARATLASREAEMRGAQQRVDLEQERLRLAEARTRDGDASESELLDTHDELTAAEIELTLARTALRLAEVELLAALGW